MAGSGCKCRYTHPRPEDRCRRPHAPEVVINSGYLFELRRALASATCEFESERAAGIAPGSHPSKYPELWQLPNLLKTLVSPVGIEPTTL